jgi:hypothetical protein
MHQNHEEQTSNARRSWLSKNQEQTNLSSLDTFKQILMLTMSYGRESQANTIFIGRARMFANFNPCGLGNKIIYHLPTRNKTICMHCHIFDSDCLWHMIVYVIAHKSECWIDHWLPISKMNIIQLLRQSQDIQLFNKPQCFQTESWWQRTSLLVMSSQAGLLSNMAYSPPSWSVRDQYEGNTGRD